MQSHPVPHGRAWPTTRITLLQSVADQRDKGSWDCFAQIYGPLIQRYCVRRGLQEADAFDVVQDVLMQVSRGISTFEYDAGRGRFRNWLGTITHRAMLKHQAKWRRKFDAAGGAKDSGVLSPQECPHPVDEGWVEAFNSYVFEEALRRLQPSFTRETWRAFNATFIEGQPPSEVADEIGRSVGWVYQAKSQIMRQLKTEILYLAEDSVLHNQRVGG
jgi:RNA polymerase sigma factor (sigma-70 family)